MKLRAHANIGFTLIEVIVAISIAAILSMIAIPSFQNASLTSQLRSATNNFVATANFARSEAIKRGGTVIICVSPDGVTCGTGGWEQGWIVLSGSNVLMRQSAATSGFKVTATGGLASLSFQPIGVGATPTTVTVCRATPRAGSQERVITLDSAGRIWTKSTATGTCS